MKANETRVAEFLSSPKTQFVIPVYQRNYDWTKVQCQQLLADILDVAESETSHAHFIGSIVYVHDDVYTSSRTKELVIIDGQQRLTTLTLIYLAISQLAMETNNQDLFNEISETYLINKFASDDEKLKLRATEGNQDALRHLMQFHNTSEFNGYSNLIENFNFFRKKITPDSLPIIESGLSKLMFVEISLDRNNDNPQRIFESLNSTGLELSQADLIRNYILMGLSREDQEKYYKQYWELIENNAKEEASNQSRVSDFIRDFLTLENNKIPVKAQVYSDFKKHHDSNSEELESTLQRLKSLSYSYKKLINPEREEDLDIRKELSYLNLLEVNVAHPFLMKVYEDFSNGFISKSIFLSILRIIQSFTWRRFVIGLPTNALGKIFMSLYDKVDMKNYLASIELALVTRSGSQRFPHDIETTNALKEKDFYNIKAKNRVYLFERLENHNNPEYVDIENNPKITIEHIFPQNPVLRWKDELGDVEFTQIQESYLNSIGNLTVSGNNGKLSNKYFSDKRDLPEFGYKESRLWLNKYLSSCETWDSNEIIKRAEILSERFLEIWPFPDVEIVKNNRASQEVNIFLADEPTHKKLDYAVFLDQKIKVREVSKLFTEVITILFEFEPQRFFNTSLVNKLSLTKSPENLRHPIRISDSYFIEGNLSNLEKFERIKEVLNFFNLEDELSIKYEEAS